MAILTTTIIFSNGDQVTSGKLNEIIAGATFDSGAVADGTLVIVAGQIKLGTVLSGNMGAGSVLTASLADGAVSTVKIANGAVSSQKIGNLAVSTNNIANGAVTFDKLDNTLFATKQQTESQFGNYVISPDIARNLRGATKAYVEFAIGTGGDRPTGANAYNVASVTRLGATTTRVTFTQAMNSSAYTVSITGGSNGAEQVTGTYFNRGAGGFDIIHTTEGTGRRLSILVNGVYAS